MKKILILVALVMYVPLSELSAKRKAEKFCDSVPLGAAVGDLLDKALASGARENSTQWTEEASATRRLYVTYTGFYPGSDFICEITERNGVVVKKNPYLAASLF